MGARNMHTPCCAACDTQRHNKQHLAISRQQGEQMLCEHTHTHTPALILSLGVAVKQISFRHYAPA